ncbi:MAG: hypothetical protein RSF81_01675 [Oscillospiraceae bacterium]
MKIQKIISVALVIAMLAAQPLQNYTVAYAKTSEKKSVIQMQKQKDALVKIINGKLYLIIDSIKYVPYDLKDASIQFKSVNGVKCIQFTDKTGKLKCIKLFNANNIQISGKLDNVIVDEGYSNSQFGFADKSNVKNLEVNGNSSVSINPTIKVEKVVAKGTGKIVIAENAQVSQILATNKGNITLPQGSTVKVEQADATPPAPTTEASGNGNGTGSGGGKHDKDDDKDDSKDDNKGDITDDNKDDNKDDDKDDDKDDSTDEDVNSDLQLINEAYRILNFRNATGITSNIIFQKTCKGCNLQWTSSEESIISNDGTVTRPKYGEANANLKVTAKITKGIEIKEKTFDVTVLALNDKEHLSNVKEDLSIADDLNSITQDIILPTEKDGVKISWETLSPKYITKTGSITRPEWASGIDYYEASLKATITCNKLSDVKYFAMKILKQADPGVSDEDKVASAIKNLEIKGLDDVTSDIHLPTVMTGEDVLFDTANISWKSSNTNIISNTGFVTRPAYGESNETITLTATVTVGKEAKAEKVFTATVKAITEKEKFDEVYKAFNLSNINTVKENITLPENFEGATISWASDNIDVISSAGIVVRPKGDDSIVKLTATIKLGETQKTKTFTIKVLAVESTETGELVKGQTIIASSADIEKLDSSKIYDEVLIKNVNENIDLSKITINKLTFGEISNFMSRAVRFFSLSSPVNVTLGSVNKFDVNLPISQLKLEKGNNKETMINGNESIDSIITNHKIVLRGKLIVPTIETNSDLELNTDLNLINPIIVMKNSDKVTIGGSISSIHSIQLSSDAKIDVPVEKIIEITSDAPETINVELNSTAKEINAERIPVNSNIVLSGSGTLDWLYVAKNATLNINRINNIMPVVKENISLDGSSSIGSIALDNNSNKLNIACTNVDEVVANSNVSLATNIKKLVANANDIVVKIQNDSKIELLSVADGVTTATVEGKVEKVEILSTKGEVTIKLDKNVKPEFRTVSTGVTINAYNKDDNGNYIKSEIDGIETQLSPPVILYENGHSKNRKDYKTAVCDDAEKGTYIMYRIGTEGEFVKYEPKKFIVKAPNTDKEVKISVFFKAVSKNNSDNVKESVIVENVITFDADNSNLAKKEDWVDYKALIADCKTWLTWEELIVVDNYADEKAKYTTADHIVTNAQVNKLNSAIGDAQKFVDDPNSHLYTKAQLQAAYDTLSKIERKFADIWEKQIGDKIYTKNFTTAYETNFKWKNWQYPTAMDGFTISADGKETEKNRFWVTKADYDIFVKELTKYEEMYNEKEKSSTQAEYDAATKKLENALSTFKATMKKGNLNIDKGDLIKKYDDEKWWILEGIGHENGFDISEDGAGLPAGRYYQKPAVANRFIAAVYKAKAIIEEVDSSKYSQAEINAALEELTAVKNIFAKSWYQTDGTLTGENTTETAKNNLTLGDISAVTSNIKLPIQLNGAAITWTSASEEFITNDGIVTRPTYTKGDVEVVMTATITFGKGGDKVTKTRDFVVTVSKKAPDNAEQVTIVINELAFADTLVKEDKLTFPTYSGAEITWESLTPDVITDNGIVTRNKEKNVNATMKATIKVGEDVGTKEFELLVLKAGASDLTPDERIDMALRNLTLGSIDSVKKNITLPITQNDVAVSWKSSDETVITNAGVVTRPTFIKGDAQVTLTATFTLEGGITKTKDFVATVIKNAITDNEKIALAKEKLVLKGLNAVSNNLYLEETIDGIAISWKSSNEQVIDNTGKITRKENSNGTATLTATLSSGDATDTKVFEVTVLKSKFTDEELCQAAIEAIAFKEPLDKITEDVDIPRYIYINDVYVYIEWEVTDNTAVKRNGEKLVITSPKYTEQDVDFVFTAKAQMSSKDPFLATKTFNGKVLKKEMTNAEKAQETFEKLTVTDKSFVDENLKLLTEFNGATISWKSDNADIIASTGVVTKPAATGENTKVVLTATITVGDVSLDKTFTLMVLKEGATDLNDKEKVEIVVANLTLDDVSAIKDNMTLPVLQDTVEVAWATSDSAIIATDGTVTRPDDDNKESVNVTLTATITSGTEIRTKEFVVTVMRCDIDVVQAKERLGTLTIAELLRLNNVQTVDDFENQITFPATIFFRGQDIKIDWEKGENKNLVIVDNIGTILANDKLSFRMYFSYKGDRDVYADQWVTISKVKTAQEKVDEAKANLTLSNINLANLKADFTLPLTQDEAAITWTSENTAIGIDNATGTATVTRPLSTEVDVSGTITATIKVGDVSATKVFDATVIKQLSATATDKEKVDEFMSTLIIADTALVDFAVPAAASGLIVEWSSTDNAIVIDNTTRKATVTRPDGDKSDVDVTLTAKVTSGDVSDSKTFKVNVQKFTFAEIKELLDLGIGAEVTQNFEVPTIFKGATIVWNSNSHNVTISGTTATVTPSATDATPVTLTADITLNSENDFKEFSFTVPQKVLTDAEVIEEAVNQIKFTELAEPISAITKDFELPYFSFVQNRYYYFTWSSGDKSVINFSNSNVKVKRPTAEQGNKDVIVTVTVADDEGKVIGSKVLTFTVLADAPVELPPSEKAQKALDTITIQDLVTGTDTVTLPTNVDGVAISWASDNNAAIDPITGEVTATESVETSVVLTATATVGDVKVTKNFNVTVIRNEFTANMYNLELAINKLNLNDIALDNLTSNFTVPLTQDTATITWTSENTAITFDGANATVTRPEFSKGNSKGMIRATVTCGDVYRTKDFATVVIEKDGRTEQDIVNDARDRLTLNPTDAELTTGFKLLSQLEGVSIAWSSNNPEVVAISDVNATVTPSTVEDTTVIVTATLTFSHATATKDFTIVIPKKAAGSTDDQAKVDEAKAILALDSGVDASKVAADLYLTTSFATEDYPEMAGVTIAWISSNPDVVSIAGNYGMVTRPEADVSLTLTATIAYGSATVTKDFPITVVSKNTITQADLKNAICAKILELNKTFTADSGYINNVKVGDTFNAPTSVMVLGKEFVFIPSSQNKSVITAEWKVIKAEFVYVGFSYGENERIDVPVEIGE